MVALGLLIGNPREESPGTAEQDAP